MALPDDNNFSKEVAKELIKETARPAFKAVTTAGPSDPDPQRTTKQMLEQFGKIKEGLKADLEKEVEEHRRVVDRIDDLEHAIRVLTSAQAMLDVD